MPNSPPSSQLEQGLRILSAEARDGYRDQVVIGGLAGYVRHLASTVSDDRVAQAQTLLADYGSLPNTERSARLAAAWALLNEAGQPVNGERPAPVPAAKAARPADPRRVSTLAAPVGATLDTEISALRGIGPQRARLFKRLGLVHVQDLLFHYPTRHIAYPPPRPIGDLLFADEASVVGRLEHLQVDQLPRGLKRMRATIRDDTGWVEAVWLRHGTPYLGIDQGDSIALSGKLQRVGRRLTFENPDFERADDPPVHTRGLVPVYASTAGLFDKALRTRIHWAILHFADAVPDPLPDAVREQFKLLDVGEALRSLHFPANAEAFERGRHRFAFQELLTIQLAVLQRRHEWQAGGAVALARRPEALDGFERGLPFTLTGAQRRVVHEILSDLDRPLPMTRLLQGEVGSGKTAVAAMALIEAVANGYQAALTAPTEILAEQHFATLSSLFGAAGSELERALGRRPSIGLLTGSVKGKSRSSLYAAAADGSLDILVGTQALIQQALDFGRLAVIVVDEQHRFGVKQRVTLRRKVQEASVPHLLVMTATPIPRTLALSLYGDLDLSVLDEMPAGRKPVKTVLLGPSERHLAYERVRRAALAGQQSFIICPLVEESDALEARAATEEYEQLRTGELKALRLGLLHGRMRPADKDTVMRAFRDHELDALVSTAVVEVGVDVPSATVMLIEGADRFGLAQLHQFRGRVGRGEAAAVCILLSDLADPSTNERLRAVESSASGLELAEVDLRLRGPGDYFGVRQSGLPDLKLARLDDAALVEQARAAATRLLEQDPLLEQPVNAALREHLSSFAAQAGEPN
ncbi:MAG: ATP-dependent DNA helicase RecG [Chloroflexi bacterium]|nr:ATP-dependent DNA helicase RecG [Chloroflexota bacterium]